MRSLYLLLAVLVMAPAAMAQWTYAGDFPGNGTTLTPHNHGLAVDPDGKVWIQSYYAQTGDSVTVSPFPEAPPARCKAATGKCAVSVLTVLRPDGTPVAFSPLSIVTLPGGIQDTLGGAGSRNSTGKTVFDYNTGRGMDSGPSGDIYASFGGASTLYRFDYKTGAVKDFVRLSEIGGSTAPSLDAAGNVFITGVLQDPIAIYSPDLDFVGTVVSRDRAINRDILVLPDGNTVFSLNYTAGAATIYRRDDEFDTSWDSTGITFKGMKVESATINPKTGNVWASSGSPNDLPSGRYQQQKWYEFTVADMLANQSPVPRDSIAWNNPNFDKTLGGRPRAIAFSPDGMTAYVGEFNLGANAVQKFTKGTTATEGTIESRASLGQNQPNPFSGSTDIAFSLEQPAYTRLRVLDLTGREVAVLVDSQMGVGEHRATFRPQGLASGVYVYMLEVDGQATTRRMLHIVR